MKVTVREKLLKNGRLSLYLDFYPPIKNADNKFTRREFLNRQNFVKPKSEIEKNMNRENLLYAEGIRINREKEILNGLNGMFDKNNKKRDFLEYFKEKAEKRKDSKGNYDNWQCAYKYLFTFSSGKCTFGDLTESYCEEFKDFLLKSKKLNTRKNLQLAQNSAVSYFNKFRCAVNDAFHEKLLNENPIKYVKGIPQKESKREFLTLEELQLLKNTECDLELLKTASLFSALTGLRWSDLSKLKWKDIQLTGGNYFIHIIQEKTQDTIVHPINKTAVKLLGEVGNPNDKIFDGLNYSDFNNDLLKGWVKRAGITKKITLHNFRHTYATLLLNGGADILTVSKMLGHKNIATTLIYAKVLTEAKVNAANLIEIEL